MTGAEVRDLCLSLPGTTEKATWGDETTPGHPTFRVRDKIFVIMADDESGGSIKTSHGEQGELVSAFPEAARVAAYVGRYGWTDVEFSGIPEEILRDIIVGAWARTAPKKVAEAWRALR
jgi:predicted DNA-binding protein (MmcQ/YjbR family)